MYEHDIILVKVNDQFPILSEIRYLQISILKKNMKVR